MSPAGVEAAVGEPAATEMINQGRPTRVHPNDRTRDCLVNKHVFGLKTPK